MRRDLDRARSSPREHWHAAVFICACVGLVAVALAHWRLMSPRAATAAGIAGVVYVVLTTWIDTRSGGGGHSARHR